MARDLVPIVSQGTEVARGVQARQEINADPAAFGSTAGVAIAQAGATIANTGDRMQRRAEIMAVEDNETAAKAGDVTVNDAFRGMLFDPEKGYFTKKGKDAVDAYPDLIKQAQKTVNDTAETIKNPAARRMFQDIANRRLDNALDGMAKHAAIERRTYLDSVSIARASSSAEDAVAYASDAAKREASLNVGRGEIVTFGRDHGEAPEVTQRKLRDYDTKAYTGIVQRMAITDPLGAEKFYEANRHKIDGTQQGPIESFLKQKTQVYRANGDADAIMGTGTGGPYSEKVGKVESGGNYGGKPNASTNAGGKYGFIDSTFLEQSKKHAPDLVAGKTDAQILELKKADTPEGRKLQDVTFGGFTRENEKALTDAGIPINDATRHMSHWFGAAGAVKILKADAATPIETFFKAGKGADGKMRSPEDWAAENGVKGMTVGQVRALAERRMGTGKTALPDEGGVANARTSTDPREIERDMQQNLSDYLKRAEEIADPERRDNAIAEVKRRYQLQVLQVAAREKADTADAWKIAVTPGQNGARPTSQDAIPADLWVRLDPKHQEALTRQFAHNAKGSEPPDNPGLYYVLNREAQDDPDAFKARNLFLNKPDLPNHRWDDLVKLQRSIVKADAKEYKLTDAMRVASIPLKNAGFDLSEKAHAKDKEVLGQFQGALQDWVTQYQEVNKKPPTQADVLKQVDGMLIQGRLRGEGLFGSDVRLTAPKQVEGPTSQKGTRGSKPGATFNFQVTPSSRGSFYVPFDDIPTDRRAAVEKALVDRKLIGPSGKMLDIEGNEITDYQRRKVIENAYGAWLAGGGK